jgi:hypothetical protein
MCVIVDLTLSPHQVRGCLVERKSKNKHKPFSVLCVYDIYISLINSHIHSHYLTLHQMEEEEEKMNSSEIHDIEMTNVSHVGGDKFSTTPTASPISESADPTVAAATATTPDATVAATTNIIPNHQSPSSSSSPPKLLSTVQSLVRLELSLTQSLMRIQPLLQELATPKTMSQVHTILSLARSYSTKTSAPPGWNPNLPVIHFSTPNPLPHQLRQGEMGAMELKMAKEERTRKRRKIQEEKMQQKALQESQRRNSQVLQMDRAHDPKKREIMDHMQMDHEESERRRMEQDKKRMVVDRNIGRSRDEQETTRGSAAGVNTSMNLSESSEEEEEDDDDSSTNSKSSNTSF